MNGLRLALPALLMSLPLAAAAQAPAPTKPQPIGDALSTCTGCHSIANYQASFPQVFRVPKIGGQSPEYIVAALQAYKKGERNHPTMKAIAQGLTDQQMAELAAYFAARGAQAN